MIITDQTHQSLKLKQVVKTTEMVSELEFTSYLHSEFVTLLPFAAFLIALLSVLPS
jgi:hypothetical protein